MLEKMKMLRINSKQYIKEQTRLYRKNVNYLHCRGTESCLANLAAIFVPVKHRLKVSMPSYNIKKT